MTDILILLFLISSIYCTDIVDIDYSFQTHFGGAKGNKTQAFRVNFEDKTLLQYFMKIEAISEDDSPAPLLCFSTTDFNCSSREQLVKNAAGKNAIIWLKKEEFSKEEDSFFIYVQCENEACSYNITVKGDRYATFGPNFVYSYLVSSYNREMNFQIAGIETNGYMTVALEGSSAATLNVENFVPVEINYRKGYALTFSLQDIGNESIMTTITVKGANVGEYLTLSVHLIDDDEGFNIAQNLILPNGPEVTGYLEKTLINEECFKIDLSDSKYNSISQLYVTGRIHTKYAWVYMLDENGGYLDETLIDIFDGQLSFVFKNNKNLNYICFEIPNEPALEQYQMAFSFSVTEPNSLSNLYNYYPPQNTGEIYRRMIPKGSIAGFLWNTN